MLILLKIVTELTSFSLKLLLLDPVILYSQWFTHRELSILHPGERLNIFVRIFLCKLKNKENTILTLESILKTLFYRHSKSVQKGAVALQWGLD